MKLGAEFEEGERVSVGNNRKGSGLKRRKKKEGEKVIDLIFKVVVELIISVISGFISDDIHLILTTLTESKSRRLLFHHSDEFLNVNY